MERTKPVRKSYTNTSELLTWSEVPPPDSPAPLSGSGARSHQPSDRISKVLHGGQVTDEEAESLGKMKPCSGYKLKEITGSGIFASKGEEGASETDNKTCLRVYQQAVHGVSQISFANEESITPKKPSSVAEVAKQRELSGTLKSDSDAKINKQISNAKCKELVGNDIFGPPPEIVLQPLSAPRTLEVKENNKDMAVPPPRTLRTSVKVSNPAGGQSNILFSEDPVIKTAKKIHDQKFQELTGNNIFKGNNATPGSAEKSLSTAKLKEMSGSDIFSDGKTQSRDYLGGVRKPPGGESSIALI